MTSAGQYGGHSMVAPLRRVMVCPPRACGWCNVPGWAEMGYLHPPVCETAQAQHDRLRAQLDDSGIDVVEFGEAGGLSADAVYVHDASMVTDFGVICLNMGKACRRGEPAAHARFYERIGIPVLGEVRAPGTAEAGDLVWLDANTLLAGRGYRTNAAGIEQLRGLLAPHGIEVLSAPLPHSSGPGCCLHLMSLVSLLDERTALVDLPWLAVETLELLRERGFRLVEIESSERETLACNVLALGEERLLALEENPRSNARLRAAGFEVRTFPGSEIGVNGGGGPTCLTRPIWRG
jgi:N-dimethylarginine dimethylaminohydrolase